MMNDKPMTDEMIAKCRELRQYWRTHYWNTKSHQFKKLFEELMDMVIELDEECPPDLGVHVEETIPVSEKVG